MGGEKYSLLCSPTLPLGPSANTIEDGDGGELSATPLDATLSGGRIVSESAIPVTTVRALFFLKATGTFVVGTTEELDTTDGAPDSIGEAIPDRPTEFVGQSTLSATEREMTQRATPDLPMHRRTTNF